MVNNVFQLLQQNVYSKREFTIYTEYLNILKKESIFYEKFQEVCFFFIYGNLILSTGDKQRHYQDLLFYLLESKKHGYKDWFSEKNANNLGKIIDSIRVKCNTPVFIFSKHLPSIYDIFLTDFISTLSRANLYLPLNTCNEPTIEHYANIVSSKDFNSYLGKPTETSGKLPIFLFFNKNIYILNIALYHLFQQEGEVSVGLDLPLNPLISYHMRKIESLNNNTNPKQINNYELQTANLISVTREQLTQKNKEEIEMLRTKERQALEVVSANVKKQVEILEKRNALISLPYPEYLQTDHWAALRSQAIVTAKQVCQDCKARCHSHQLQVHHKHYNSLGNENIHMDLEVLCSKCHQAKSSIFDTFS